MLVTVAIVGTMMGLSFGTMVQLYRNFGAVDAYRSVHENARRSVAKLSSDLRSGSSLTSYATNDITFSAVDSSGNSKTVRYRVVSGLLNRTVTPSSGAATTEVLTENVTALSFERWTRPGLPAAVNDDAFEVRAVLGITNAAFYRISTDTLQTRVKMRNKTY
jgi:hypothetical protein